MKFVALALAVLLAAGCQARFLQADGPSQYEHVRAAVVTDVDQITERAQKLEELRKDLGPTLEDLHQVPKKLFDEYRENLESALKEYFEKNTQGIQDFRTNVDPGIKELQEKLKVNVEETKSKLIPIMDSLDNRLIRGLEEAKARFGPRVQEYREQIEGVFTELRSKHESGELQEKFKKLVEELTFQLKGFYDTIVKSIRS